MLPPVDRVQPETSQSSPAKTLSKLVKENHVNHSVVWDVGQVPINIPPEHRHLGVHTVHIPHPLFSLYLLVAGLNEDARGL